MPDQPLEEVLRRIIREEMGSRFDAVGEQLGSMEGRLSSLESRLGSLEKRVTDGFAWTEEQFEWVGQRFEDLEKQVTEGFEGGGPAVRGPYEGAGGCDRREVPADRPAVRRTSFAGRHRSEGGIMSGRKTKTNGVTRPRPKHPDLRKATPEALARALLRPGTPPDRSLKKSSRKGS